MRLTRWVLGGNPTPADALRRSGFLYATAALYLLAAILYFVGFARIEGEATLWAYFAMGGALLLLQAARLPQRGRVFRSMVLMLLAIGALANWIPIRLYFLNSPGTDAIDSYLGATMTPQSVWPHVALLALSAGAALQLLLAPRPLSTARDDTVDEDLAAITRMRQRVGGLWAFGLGVVLGGLAVVGWNSSAEFVLVLAAIPASIGLVALGLRLSS